MEKIKKIPKKSIIEFIVVGIGKNENFHHFTDNDNIKLVPEPDNPYDKHAIRVYANDMPVAYVSKDTNKHINLVLKRGSRLKYYLIDKYSLSVRYIVIDIDMLNNGK